MIYFKVNGKSSYSFNITFFVNIKESNCQYDDNFTCPSYAQIICSKSLQQCFPNLYSNYCDISTPFYCQINQIYQCTDHLFKCDCPKGFSKCAKDNKCLSPDDYNLFCSPKLNKTCPENFPFICNDGSCRKSYKDCPSQRVCPIGLILCPNNECQLNLFLCENITKSCKNHLCLSDYSTCVIDPVDCPTEKTCGENKVVCPDGECVESEHNCSSQLFSLKNVVCGLNEALCEDNLCREICTNHDSRTSQNNYHQFFIACPEEQIKCPDYSCRNHQNNCLKRSCKNLLTVLILI